MSEYLFPMECPPYIFSAGYKLFYTKLIINYTLISSVVTCMAKIAICTDFGSTVQNCWPEMFNVLILSIFSNVQVCTNFCEFLVRNCFFKTFLWIKHTISN